MHIDGDLKITFEDGYDNVFATQDFDMSEFVEIIPDEDEK